jgi:hypothetical protein
VRILLRGDSAFAREELMAWCERSRVDYVFGLARNDRLVAAIEAEMADASAECRTTDRPARRFKDLLWSTLSSWSRRRRVIGKAEALPPGDNPRFIVTSLQPAAADARLLYERVYCARGEIENRIKECQLDLGACPRAGRRPDPWADRTSAKSMRANQLRLWFASIAYVLLCALRRIGLAHTRFAQATCGTIPRDIRQHSRDQHREETAALSLCPDRSKSSPAHPMPPRPLIERPKPHRR